MLKISIAICSTTLTTQDTSVISSYGMLDCESESRQQVGFFKKNPTKGPHLVLHLQVCTANLMTSIFKYRY